MGEQCGHVWRRDSGDGVGPGHPRPHHGEPGFGGHRLPRGDQPFSCEPPTGAIVNVSSHQAQRAVRGALPYATAKAAVEGLTRAVAVDHGPAGIRCNAVALGSIRTERYERFVLTTRRWTSRWPTCTRWGGWEPARRSPTSSPSCCPRRPHSSTARWCLSMVDEPPRVRTPRPVAQWIARFRSHIPRARCGTAGRAGARWRAGRRRERRLRPWCQLSRVRLISGSQRRPGESPADPSNAQLCAAARRCMADPGVSPADRSNAQPCAAARRCMADPGVSPADRSNTQLCAAARRCPPADTPARQRKPRVDTRLDARPHALRGPAESRDGDRSRTVAQQQRAGRGSMVDTPDQLRRRPAGPAPTAPDAPLGGPASEGSDGCWATVPGGGAAALSTTRARTVPCASGAWLGRRIRELQAGRRRAESWLR